SPRPPIPSPLSATSNVATSLPSASPSESAAFWTQQASQSIGSKTTEKPSIKAPVGQTAYYSEPSSPFKLEEEVQRLRVAIHLNKGRSFSEPEASNSTHGDPKSTEPTVTATAMPSSSTNSKPHGLPQSPSTHDASTHDTPTATSTSKQGSKNKAGPQEAQNSADIASIIEAAGSPEVVIQHLLKEKHAQSQQNTQLWRLVDKQLAMILGLKKDLESALKDKEKYRRKLKETWSNPAVVKALASPKQEEEEEEEEEEKEGATRHIAERGAASPQIEVPKSRPLAASHGLDSPSFDSDSQINSPIDVSIAPCPFTPPVDKPQTDGKDEDEERPREPSRSTSVPPARIPPSDPPNSPPPKLPIAPPSLSGMEPSPQAEKDLDKFPSPPRKEPPVALQLQHQVRRNLAVSAAEDENDSDSDYEDILDVNDDDDAVVDEIRGRRKTRDDDDKEREVVALREAQARSSSAQTLSENPSRRSFHRHASLSPLSTEIGQNKNTSVDALPVTRGRNHGVPPQLSLGLPNTPRPFGSIRHSSSAPLSARLGPAVPFSPRPPHHLMVHASNLTPWASSTSAESPERSPAALASQASEALGGAASRPFPEERTEIYKGLVTEEYPDLLLPPNALPSIMVKVASSRMKPSRASLMFLTQLEEDPVFTLAVLSRADHGELWRIEKDIASLGRLDARMRNCAALTAKTPERSLFNGHAPAKLDARRVALEQYMDELLDTPFDVATAVELCKYLSSNTLPPNTDEAGSSLGWTHEGSAAKAGADSRSVRSGYLTKKGKNFGGWKARFFVLDGPRLKYYETPGGAHLGTIKLQNAQIGKQSPHPSNENHSHARQNGADDLDDQYRHAFLILEPKKKDASAHVKHVLCAESDAERDLWVDALLQWIEPPEAEDADRLPPPPPPPPPMTTNSPHPPAVNDAHERLASSGTTADNASGNRPTKKNQQGRAHQHEDSGALIGVRYDSTHAGEAPHKGAAALSELANLASPQGSAYETMSSQANKLISGPKDPHIISDSAAWGNKPGLSIPLLDEKKQRKRSFFGFGPKTRSSSDGQDSLFGGSDNGSAVGQQLGPSHLHSYPGPVRQVFGATLAEAARYNPPMDVNVPLPSVVYRCIQYLDYKDATAEEGIFRVSGSNVVIKQLRERFNMESDVNLIADEQYYDIHAVASLLKLYLRELPTTILTKDLHLDFLSTNEIQDRQEKIARLAELTQLLPLVNATLLKYLIAFLLRIINNSDVNKMNVRNVGIVFSPTLNIPAQVFAMFLQSYQGIFGIDPAEYELPVFPSESDLYGHTDVAPSQAQAQPCYQQQQQQQQQQQHYQYQQQHSYQYQHQHQQQPFDLPRRPSTSSGSASPHRQPRLDHVREQARLTPTPPLMSTAQNIRGSPTPPLVGRAAYDGSYAAPATHDGHSYYPAQRATPGYDRFHYQSCNGDQASAESQMSMQARRRESSMMMGGMMNVQHQASKSRLREATRY
ncbi:hypothetical protein E4U53_002437, partial [Claviceps sorghi]